MNNYICIKNNRDVSDYSFSVNPYSVGQEYVCHFNPFSDCFQIYKPGENELFAFVTIKDFNEHFIRKDIYREKQIEKILE
mgnify:CR=1 FL=1